MGNVIENRAVVELVPLGPTTPGPAQGWLVGPVRVERAEDVPGWPNLLSAELPRELEALIPAAVLDQLGPSPRWRVVASLVGPGRLRVEQLA